MSEDVLTKQLQLPHVVVSSELQIVALAASPVDVATSIVVDVLVIVANLVEMKVSICETVLIESFVVVASVTVRVDVTAGTVS